MKMDWINGISFIALLAVGFVGGQIAAPISWLYYDATGNPRCISRTCFFWKAKSSENETARWEATRENRYFADIDVVGQATKKPLTVSEVAEILYKSSEVNGVSYPVSTAKHRFNVESLAYPQNAALFAITKEEWEKLVALCQANLQTSGYAHSDIVSHWKSIVAGNPPFGLRVTGKR